MNFSIKSIAIYVALTLCSSFSLSFAKEHFEVELIESGLINNETRIYLCDDAGEIGFLSYTKVPFINRYAIHTFYVHPKMRNKGYGTKLLHFTCDRLKNIGACLIYIQPGPFEFIDGRFQDVQTARELKTKQLVKLYQKCDFMIVDKVTQIIAYILYKCMGIDEDSSYLLYKSL